MVVLTSDKTRKSKRCENSADRRVLLCPPVHLNAGEDFSSWDSCHRSFLSSTTLLHTSFLSSLRANSLMLLAHMERPLRSELSSLLGLFPRPLQTRKKRKKGTGKQGSGRKTLCGLSGSSKRFYGSEHLMNNCEWGSNWISLETVE